LGLALWTKLPAILLLPALPFYVLLPQRVSWPERWVMLIKLGTAVAFGLGIFMLLKLHPAFGQLFSRGSDFLYPVSEVIHGAWKVTVFNIPNYLSYFLAYLTLPVVLLVLFGMFSPDRKRQHWVLLVTLFAFLGPIALLGKVVYPRYLLPVALPFTVIAALAIEEVSVLWVKRANTLWLKISTALLVALIVSNVAAQSAVFMVTTTTQPNQTPFVTADQTQYLTEWSSGHGITDSVALIQELAQDQTVAVATEGYFGTLPDAVLMYLHNQDVSNIYVEGVGQPVRTIPDSFADRAASFDRVLLVVNSHRLDLTLPSESLLLEVCRPFDAPCLQVWEISDKFQN
jgi:hypothetical protein